MQPDVQPAVQPVVQPVVQRVASCIRGLNITCEVHHLAFHTCLFPRFPVFQFGAAFSSLAFSFSPV